MRQDTTVFHYKPYRTICLLKPCLCITFIKIKIEVLAAVWRIGWRRGRKEPGKLIKWSKRETVSEGQGQQGRNESGEN